MSAFTFKQAQELFETARDKTAGKPLANNTRLVRCGKAYGIKLHETVVVRINPDSTYQVFTGGWNTVTTRDRVNTYLPKSVRLTTQRSVPLVTWGFVAEGSTRNWTPQSEFYEGIRINARGKVISRIKDPTRTQKLEKKLQRRIATFIREYLEHIAAGKLAKPSGGDCWNCSLLGDSGTEHLFSHMTEKYFVPSLLVNAMRVSYNPQYASLHAEPFFAEGREANESALKRHSMARCVLQKYFRTKKSAMFKAVLVGEEKLP